MYSWYTSDMIGYIGLALLITAYLTLLTPYKWLFTSVSFIASVLLTIHAFILADIPFIIVNGFVALIVLATFIKDKTWRNFTAQ